MWSANLEKGLDNALVATDVAPRVIDVSAAGLVMNYDVPTKTMIYFHSILKTSRASGLDNIISLEVP